MTSWHSLSAVDYGMLEYATNFFIQHGDQVHYDCHKGNFFTAFKTKLCFVIFILLNITSRMTILPNNQSLSSEFVHIFRYYEKQIVRAGAIFDCQTTPGFCFLTQRKLKGRKVEKFIHLYISFSQSQDN